jgi:dipeptidyl aminopeptidase/acylaminoacyl peptidase
MRRHRLDDAVAPGVAPGCRKPRHAVLFARTLVALCALAVAPAARSEEPVAPSQDTAAAHADRLDVATYLEWESIEDPQISPDGSQVLYTRRWVDKLADEWAASLWLMNADGTHNRFLVKGSHARWSPDATRIAYLAAGEPKGTQIFVRWMDASGATTQVTRVTESPGNLRWSPDGERLAFTMRVPTKDAWKIDMPAAPEGATWTEPPRLVQTMHYRQDRRGFMQQGWMHLFVVPAEGGTPGQITTGEWNVGARPTGIVDDVGLAWTPDGRTLVFDGLREQDADLRYRESHLYAVDVESREVRQITSRKGPWTAPVVSPDGRRVACVGYDWTPQTYKADELWVVEFDGTNMRRISGDFDRDPDQLHWAPDGRSVYFTADDRGTRNVFQAALAGGPVRQVTQGTHILSLTSVASNGLAVGVRSSFHQPDDVVAFRLPRPQGLEQLTRVNEDVLGGKKLGAVAEIWTTSTNDARVQGWLVQPPDFDPGQKYPLILHIHGGPHAMYGVGFNYSFQNLAANGYLVLYTNPRGSTGYGTAFGNAIDDAYPSVDYDDLMASVDAVVARGCVDTNRLYVTGVSGGGVLSSWIVGHTNRFAAAAVRAPVIDWISFAGNTDITAWGYYRFRKPFWEDPAKWLAHSPLMYAKNVRTPVLLMTGELDLRTPMGQSEEYYQALKQLGVPAALLRFHGEYHGTSSKPSNFMRTQLYLMSWFEKYPGTAATPAAPAMTTRR